MYPKPDAMSHRHTHLASKTGSHLTFTVAKFAGEVGTYNDPIKQFRLEEHCYDPVTTIEYKAMVFILSQFYNLKKRKSFN